MQSLILASSLPLPLPFLDINGLSVTPLKCKALYIVINFLVLWSIYLSSSQVLFKNGPECLTKGTAREFIVSMRFLLESVVSRSFIVRLGYSFRIFLFYIIIIIITTVSILTKVISISNLFSSALEILIFILHSFPCS